MQRQNDSQRSALEELIELRRRQLQQHQHQHQHQQQQQPLQEAATVPIISTIATADMTRTLNPPRLGPYPYDPELSAAAAAFNESISSQSHQTDNQRALLQFLMPSLRTSATADLRNEFLLPALPQQQQQQQQRREETSSSSAGTTTLQSRRNILQQQEQERIFRIAHGLPPPESQQDWRANAAWSSSQLQRQQDSALAIGSLSNVALGQQTDPSAMRAHPHFSLTMPGSPSVMTNPFQKHRPNVPNVEDDSLSSSHQREPHKNLKRASHASSQEEPTLPLRKRKKRKRTSGTMKDATTDVSNDDRVQQRTGRMGSSFPMPALDEGQVWKARAGLSSFRQYWNGIKTGGMRREIFLRRLRALGPISLSRSSLFAGVTNNNDSIRNRRG